MSVERHLQSFEVDSSEPALVVREGRREGEVHPIGSGVLVGRGVECDLTFNDPRVSRTHAVISRESGGIYIRDYPSQNGTWVNGIRVNSGRLYHRDIVRVGSVSMRVHIPPQPVPVPEPAPVVTEPRFTKPVSASQFPSLGSMSADDYLTALGFDSSVDSADKDRDAMRRQTLHFAVLFEVSRHLQKAWRGGAVLEAVSDILLRHLRCHRLIIARLQSDGDGMQAFETVYGRDHRSKESLQGERLTSTTFARRATERREGVITNDPSRDMSLEVAQSLIFTSARAIMCVPMVFEDEVLGVVEVSAVNPAHRFSEQDLDLVTLSAALIGSALQNQWLTSGREQMIVELRDAREQLLEAQRITEERQEDLIRREQLSTLQMFAKKMVHEMRNTLGPVQLVTMIQERYPEDAELAGIVHDVIEASETALDLADDLHRYAADGHQSEFAVEPTDIAATVRSAHRYLRWDPDVVHRRIQLQLKIEEEPVVAAHRRKLRQVIINLTRNAAQSIRHDKGRVRLTVQVTERHASILVADNGCGMAPEVASRIFEPGYSTRKDEHGMGLGLDFCKGTVEAFGGVIEVRTGPDRGSTFSIRIPLLKA
jgi:signal transduction histidine kinase